MDARKTFSREFQMETVNLITDGRASIAQISKDLNIPPDTLHAWIQEFSAKKEETYPGRERLTSDAEIIRELRRENDELRLELQTLKKAAPLAKEPD